MLVNTLTNDNKWHLIVKCYYENIYKYNINITCQYLNLKNSDKLDAVFVTNLMSWHWSSKMTKT